MATTLPCPASKAPPSLPASVGCAPYPHSLSLVNLGDPCACSNHRFLEAELGNLRALHRRVQRIQRRLQRRVTSCQAGYLPINVLIAPILVRLVLDTQRLEGLMREIVQAHRQSLQQAQRSEKRLPT